MSVSSWTSFDADEPEEIDDTPQGRGPSTETRKPQQLNDSGWTQFEREEGAQDGTDTSTEDEDDNDEEENDNKNRRGRTQGQPGADRGFTDEEKVEAVLARYKNDPKELAKAIIESQKLIGRQAREVGNTRRQGNANELVIEDLFNFQPEDGEEGDGDTDNQAPVNNRQTEQQSAKIVIPDTPDKLPPAVQLLPPDEKYTPQTHRIDERTGLYLDEEGYPTVPLDDLGIPYWPKEHWAVRRRAMAEQYKDDPIGLNEAWAKLKQDYSAARMEEADKLWRNAQVRQEYFARQETAKLANKLATRMPMEDAKELALYYYGVAKTAVGQAIGGKILRLDQLVHDQLLAGAVSEAFKQAAADDQVGSHLAGVRNYRKQRGGGGNNTNKKQPNVPGMAPVRGNGGGGGRRSRSNELVGDEDSGGTAYQLGEVKLTKEQHKRYAAKNTVFE